MFWQAIAAGRSSVETAEEAGVSPPVGVRWFRSSAEMPPTQFATSANATTRRFLTFLEREDIAVELARGNNVSPPHMALSNLTPVEELAKADHDQVLSRRYRLAVLGVKCQQRARGLRTIQVMIGSVRYPPALRGALPVPLAC